MLVRTKPEVKTQLEAEIVNQFNLFKKYNKQLPVGFEDIIAKHQALITKHKSDDHQMVLVTGPEGSGKTCLLTHLAKTSREFIGQDAIVIVRYLADLNPGPYANDVLLNLCKHLNFALKLDMECRPGKCDTEMKDIFNGLLKTLSRSKHPFLIVLDGLDALKPLLTCDKNRNRYDWLTVNLPRNVHILASFTQTTKNEDELNKFIEKLHFNDNVLTVPSLSGQAISRITSEFLEGRNRKLSQEQMDLISDTLVNSGSPLMLNLVLHRALTWNTTCVPDTQMPDSVTQIIHQVSDV